MESDFAIKCEKATDLGLKRSNNEDYVDLFEPTDANELLQSGRLYIVADGVGGAAKGEKASQYATQKVLFEFYNDPDPDVGTRLKRAMRKAGNDIYEHAERNEIPSRMATTMVAANIRNGVLTVANVGDSRAYLIRSGGAQQITRDHTIVGEMLRDGEIDEEEALRVKGKNRLMRSLGGERDVQVDVFQEALQPGDRVLLCTDGLVRYTVSDDIAKLASGGTLGEVVKGCIDYANQQGGVDNVTVAVIEVGEPVTEPAASAGRVSVAPKSVDLDEMVTESSITPIRPATRRAQRSRFTRQQQVVLSVLGAAVVLIFTVVAIAFLSPKDSNTAPSIGKNTPTDTPATPGTATLTPSATSSATTILTPIPTSSPTGTGIKVGGGVRVVPSAGVYFRSEPSTATEVPTRTLAQGAVLEVIAGPVRAEDHNWWNLKDKDGATGWAAGEYLEPVPSSASTTEIPAPPNPTSTPSLRLTETVMPTPPGTLPTTPTDTSIPTPTQVAITVGGYVRVTASEGVACWSQPIQTSGTQLGTFPFDAVLKVIDGPRSDSIGLTYWQVQEETTGKTGWVVVPQKGIELNR